MPELGWLLLLALLPQFFVPGALPAPVYVTGTACPADPMTPYTRQYAVSSAIACVFDPSSNTLRGTTAEARTYLDGGPELWGDGWTGLGPRPAGLTFTGTNAGTFTLSAALAAQYGQFALGLRNGPLPRWAIFLLPAGTVTGEWRITTAPRRRADSAHKIDAVLVAVGATSHPPPTVVVFGR